jgi:hypothetical protein
MGVSVVVVTYRRLETLNGILAAWLLETEDVWLADCSPSGFKTDLPITHVRFNRDVGSAARHAAALLTSGELVIKADDDLMPGRGLAKDFERAHAAHPGAILGLIGRRFHGPQYYGGTEFFRSSKVATDTEVDFVGVCTATPRCYLAFDLRGCVSPIEDLFWQCGAFPAASKIVVATTRYDNLKEANDKGCLFKSNAARAIRQGYYAQLWENQYALKTKWAQNGR